MDLTTLAQENLALFAAGAYRNTSGETVPLRVLLQTAIQRTVLYTPEAVTELLSRLTPIDAQPAVIEMTPETTGAALARLQAEGVADTVALNFASARHPGGGFLSGARAQEEDLCRVSGLYLCLEPQHGYYNANRAYRPALYTDHMIYSPGVPIFRDEQYTFLQTPFLASFITSPAPNAGAIQKNSPELVPQIVPTLRRRFERVLALAIAHRHRTIVLGAWGCGAFRNDPGTVANVMAETLRQNRFATHLDRVVLAIYDNRPGQLIWNAFVAAFDTQMASPCRPSHYTEITGN